MSEHRDADLIVSAWVEEGPEELPSGIRAAIVASIRTSDQRHRRAFRGRLARLDVVRPASLVALVAVVAGGIYLLNPLRPSEPVAPGVSSTLPPATTPAPEGSDRASPPPTPSLSPEAATPIVVPTLEIDDLPRVRLADVDATAVCDTEPGLGDPNMPQSRLTCGDSLELAIRVVRTVTDDPIVRLYLPRQPCDAEMCTEDQLNKGEVFVWTPTQAYLVELDARLDTVEPPAEVENAPWPTPGELPAPAVRRPMISGAPSQVADREPLPFCGRLEFGQPRATEGCFRDAVLTGRPAEMLERTYGTEGQESVRVYRYLGDGRVIVYIQSKTDDLGRAINEWAKDEGGLSLGQGPYRWDFQPWDGLSKRLS